MARKIIAAVDSTTGQTDYSTMHDMDDPLPYGYAGGLSPQQVQRTYDDRPNKRTQKDDGAGNLVDRTQDEIDAYDAADPVKIKKGKKDAATATARANPNGSMKARDVLDLLGID